MLFDFTVVGWMMLFIDGGSVRGFVQGLLSLWGEFLSCELGELYLNISFYRFSDVS
jgi:hypothetical protein